MLSRLRFVSLLIAALVLAGGPSVATANWGWGGGITGGLIGPEADDSADPDEPLGPERTVSDSGSSGVQSPVVRDPVGFALWLRIVVGSEWVRWLSR